MVTELKVGDRAPSFTLADDQGASVSLGSFAGKWVIVYFYPKDMTPGCTTEACDFRDSFSRLKARGAVVLGISKDSVASHAKFKTQENLNFPLLADVDGVVCEAYGVWKEKSLYGRKYLGIERMTFLVDPEGKIAKIYPKVNVAGHVDALIEDLALGVKVR